MLAQWLFLAVAVAPAASSRAASAPAASATTAPPSGRGASDAAPAGPRPSDPETAVSGSADSEYAEQAALDVDALLTGESRAYLDARARLEAHPREAAEALLDRLSAVPAPIEAERKRLLDVLAVLEGTEHLSLFVDELRRALGRATTEKEALQQIERWLPLVAAQGDRARAPISALVGDRELPMPVRGTLLAALVELTPGEQLTELVPLVGPGHRTLRQHLVRALARRTAAHEAHRPALLAALDAELDRADVQHVPALLAARAALTRSADPDFTERLRRLALEQDAAFTVRVAALAGLARDHSPPATDALAEIAATELRAPHRDTQAGEVLAWLALRGLPADRARPLVTQHKLIDHPAPRFAEVAWKVAVLPGDQRWIDAAVSNPWPHVRVAALSRVASPCPKPSLKLLDDRARPGGDDDPAAARAAVTALGRCGAHDELVDLMNDDEVDIEQRTEASRQLTKHGGAAGADAVATALAKGPDRRFARRLALALRHAPRPTEKAVDALCALIGERTEVGQAALGSLQDLGVDPASACMAD